ncbi:MAG: hypothetical protein SFV23_07665 [Planctomycetaceae bacterium]|nr:hypothetical protein [Planctomycetaceae bacterium]
MPKKRAVSAKKSIASPPSAEAREHLLTVITGLSEPVIAKALAKLLVPQFQMTPADLDATLQEFVANGRLLQYPPAKTSGQPRFWDRDVATLAKPAILEALSGSAAPVTARELLPRLTVPFPIKEADLIPVLESCVRGGELHAIPPVTKAKQPRYWNHDVHELGRRFAVQILKTKGPLAKSKLQAALKGFNATEFAEIFASLQASRSIYPHPPLTKTGAVLYGDSPVAPEKYLAPVGKSLAQVVANLHEVSVSVEDLRRAVVQMVEGAGVSLGIWSAASRTAAVHAPDPATVDLIAIMCRIEPGAERGALVGAGDLRRHAGLPKRAFDEAALSLSREGRLSLHQHDYPASLSPDERDELVTDGLGNYYVGMALRQSRG